MHRKSLALIATGLLLFAALFVQMAVVQAAPHGQSSPAIATDEPQPLPQPMRIQIRQLIPFTISLPASLLAGGLPVTEVLTSTAVLSGLEGIAESTTVSTTGAADAFAGTTEVVTATATTTATKTPTETGSITSTADVTLPLTATENMSMPVVLSSTPVTLELSLDLIVSDTLTSTVPASVTLRLADLTTTTLPVSISVAPLPDGEVIITLLPAPVTPTPTAAATAAPEETEAITPTAEVTTTAVAVATAAISATTPFTPSGLPVVNTTATVTANLRSGPATTFEILGQVGPGETVPIVGISQDGQWYLLDGGAWIANFLVAEQPANLPTATQELIDQAQGIVPTATPTPAATVSATVTATAGVTATEPVTASVPPAATPVPEQTGVITAVVTVDANLRAGPGTEFPVIGGTITNQVLTIVGRNADGTWFRLDNTGWVSGALLANPPALASVSIVNADGTPVEPAATPTPVPGGGGLFPTPTPLAQNAAIPSGPNASYLGSVQRIIGQYDQVLQSLDQLIAEARTNSATLVDSAWGNRVNAAVTLLRQTSATVGELQAPAELAGLQQELVAAAQGYTTAANALSQAASTGAVAQLDAADAALEQANTNLTNAETALATALR